MPHPQDVVSVAISRPARQRDRRALDAAANERAVFASTAKLVADEARPVSAARLNGPGPCQRSSRPSAGAGASALWAGFENSCVVELGLSGRLRSPPVPRPRDRRSAAQADASLLLGCGWRLMSHAMIDRIGGAERLRSVGGHCCRSCSSGETLGRRQGLHERGIARANDHSAAGGTTGFNACGFAGACAGFPVIGAAALPKSGMAAYEPCLNSA